MKSLTQEELQFLRDLRGKFEDSPSNQRSYLLCVLLFASLFPALFVLGLIFKPHQNHSLFALLAVLSWVPVYFIWRDRGVAYEFNGTDIIETRAGREKNRIAIADITETGVQKSPHQLILKSANSKMVIQMVPSLEEAIEKKEAETGESVAGQKSFQKTKQPVKVWYKRVGTIVLILAGLLFGILIGLLRKKH